MIEIVYHGEAAAAFGPDGQAGGFENADGNGEIHCYRLLDGVTAMRMRLEMNAYTTACTARCRSRTFRWAITKASAWR